MASSLSWFRRYQKFMLAALCILCMVGFVLFEPLYRMFADAGTGANPVVVRTSFADLRERELSQMVQSRAQLNRFLIAVAQMAAQNMAQTRQIQFPPEQIQMFILQQMEAAGLYAPELASEQGVVRLMLLVHEAQEMGMEVTNEAAFEYLRRVTAEQITADQLRAVMQQMGVSQRQIFDELRRSLLARNVQQAVLNVNSIQGATPAQRWNYFQRLRREVNAEVVGLPVINFVEQVGEPDESALRGLFEKHKNDYPVPGQPEPGFRIPAKGKFAGFKALHDHFAETVEVTDEEIAQYYEENKSQFPYSSIEDEPASEPDATEGAAGEQATPESQPQTDPTAEPAEPANPSAEPTRETPAADKRPAANESAAPNPGGGGDDAGTSEPQSAESGPALGAPAGATEESTAESADNEPTAATTPATEAEPPAEPATAATDEPQTTPPSTTPKIEPTDEFDLPQDIAGGATPEHDPLWKVSDRIRQTLVSQKVQTKIDEIFAALSAAMDQYANEVELYEIEQQEQAEAGAEPDPNVQAPAPLDFKKLAEQYGVEAFATELITPFEAEVLDVGQTTVDGRPFVEVAFDGMGRYSPRQAQDLEGNMYLFWKTEASKAEVPTFDQAHEDVVRAWKLIEARKVALQRANEMAAEATKSGKSLGELYGSDPKYQVAETGFFTWMTEQPLTAQFGQPRVQLGSPTGVENPGQDFMRMVYSLDTGQAGAALNAPESTAYVARLADSRPSRDELLAEFLKASGPQAQYLSVAQLDMGEFTRQWVEGLEEQAGVQWERPANERVAMR